MPSLLAPTADAIIAVRQGLRGARVEVRGSDQALADAWRQAVEPRETSSSAPTLALLVDPREADLLEPFPDGSIVLYPHLRAHGPAGVLDAETVCGLLGRAGAGIEHGGLHAGWLVLRVTICAGEPGGSWWSELLERELLVLRYATLQYAWSVRDREQLEMAFEGARARLTGLRERHRDDLARQRTSVLESQRQLATVRSQLSSAQERAERFKARAKDLEGQIKRLQQRRWWRLGQELRRATTSLGSFLTTPKRLVAVLRARPAATASDRVVEGAAGLTSASVASAPSGSHQAAEGPRAPQIRIPRLAPPEAPDAGSSRRLVLHAPDRIEAGLAFEASVHRLADAELDAREVDVLLVAGLSSLPAKAVLDRIAALRRKGVPAALWLTDERVLGAGSKVLASLFDVVYTPTAELAERVSALLGRSVAGVLPPAVQPRIHNPQEVPGGREAALGWYVPPGVRHGPVSELLRDVARTREAAILMPASPEESLSPLVALDEVAAMVPERDLPAAWRRFQAFLEPAPAFEGGLPTSLRTLEILASGTPVVGTTDPSAEGMGRDSDGILQAADLVGMEQAVDLVLTSRELRDRMSVRAVRAVHAERTYGRALQVIGRDLGWSDSRVTVPSFSAVVATMRPNALDAICANLRRQSYPQLQLILVTHGFSLAHADVTSRLDGYVEDLRVIEAPDHLGLGAITNLGFAAAEGSFIGKMDDDDHYGPHYVSDQVRAFGYTDAAIVGKRSVYTYLASMDATVLRMAGHEHRMVDQVAGPTISLRREVVVDLPFPDLPRAIDTQLQRRAIERGFRIYSTDRFNFVYVRGSDPGSHTWRLDDLELASKGRVAYYGWNATHVDV